MLDLFFVLLDKIIDVPLAIKKILNVIFEHLKGVDCSFGRISPVIKIAKEMKISFYEYTNEKKQIFFYRNR